MGYQAISVFTLLSQVIIFFVRSEAHNSCSQCSAKYINIRNKEKTNLTAYWSFNFYGCYHYWRKVTGLLELLLTFFQTVLCSLCTYNTILARKCQDRVLDVSRLTSKSQVFSSPIFTSQFTRTESIPSRIICQMSYDVKELGANELRLK